MKTYKWQRYLFFWLSIVAYFVPYVVATASLLPFMQVGEGLKWSIGITIVALNSIPFVWGIFRGFTSRFPFVNFFSMGYVLIDSFFTTPVYSDYKYSFKVIGWLANIGAIASSILWYLHLKYKQKNQTVSTVVKSGVLEAKEEGKK